MKWIFTVLGLLALLAACVPTVSGRALQPIPQPSTPNSTPRPEAPTATVQTRTLATTVPYVTPQRYSATRGEGKAQGGLYNYFDDTGGQLTDKLLGGNDVLANLGQGPAYEWVAWGVAHPRLSFHFAAPVRLKRIEIRFNRNDQAAVALPQKVSINGRVYTVRPDKIANQTSGFLSFAGSFTGRTFNIQITRGKGWVFIDEVRFVDP